MAELESFADAPDILVMWLALAMNNENYHRTFVLCPTAIQHADVTKVSIIECDRGSNQGTREAWNWYHVRDRATRVDFALLYLNARKIAAESCYIIYSYSNCPFSNSFLLGCTKGWPTRKRIAREVSGIAEKTGQNMFLN